VQQLGKDNNFQTVRGARAYQVIERRYAIFPQRSGELEIPPVVFDGKVDDPAAQTGDPFFDSFNPATRHVHLRSRKLALHIAAQPADYQGANWLPAQNIELQEKWSPGKPTFRVGEPVTRDIIIRARGLSSSQLPDLNQPAPDGLKVYPDQPQTSDTPQGETLLSKREQKIAMIPSRAGMLTLPAIHLSWWDTGTDRQRSAELPAETIRVLPAAGAASTATQTPAVESKPTDAVAQTPSRVAASPAKTVLNPGPVTGHARLWMLTSLILGLGWLGTLLIWWWTTRRHARQDVPQVTAVTPQLKPAVKLLRLACRQNNPAAVKHALLHWARSFWQKNPPLSLGELAQRVSDERLAREIRILDKCLYTDTNSVWQAPNLLLAFDQFNKQQITTLSGREDELAPLNLKQAAGNR